MKNYWDSSLTYRENYKHLVDDLEKDTRDWIIGDGAPKDGTQVYFLCCNDWQGQGQYDIGFWEDYTKSKYYDPKAPYPDCLEGEWNTQFGNCEAILGWKVVV